MAARVEIRPFLRRHLDRVVAIEQACFGADAYPRDLFLVLFAESAGLFFVARQSRRIVGYCISETNGAEAEVVSLAVSPERRARGIGGALMRHTITRLRRRSVRTVTLTVRVDNLEAIRLYRRLGFRSAGRVAHYYEDHADALIMRRRL